MVSSSNAKNAEIATKTYTATMSPKNEARLWALTLRNCRRKVFRTLKETNYLLDTGAGLERRGANMLVLRHLMAPPLSQDQLSLRFPSWPKGAGKTEGKIRSNTALAGARAFDTWRDQHLTRWLSSGRMPTVSEIKECVSRAAALIAHKEFDTEKRTLLSVEQENQVIDLLKRDGWTQLPSGRVDRAGALPTKTFMHRTKFAAGPAWSQEVDIACGLKNTYVLAMECKVTNDHTNSIKRINDILKKATSWRNHWGSFVETAALLQGVISARDVQRLTDAGVLVFWSHDLPSFQKWLRIRV